MRNGAAELVDGVAAAVAASEIVYTLSNPTIAQTGHRIKGYLYTRYRTLAAEAVSFITRPRF